MFHCWRERWIRFSLALFFLSVVALLGTDENLSRWFCPVDARLRPGSCLARNFAQVVDLLDPLLSFHGND